ncbi:predicted protein [Chaetoceros tenuissimus]|uniref:Uncharacterized protein n=1 Tax=Chaetoceros tenuissimus TaxID=426638 RepID=A0AAD3CNM8_9STRA|nr:predicted protein [Chaetoceros tenuissimus]
MTTPKARGTQALEHVIFKVLRLFDDSPLVLSLHQDGYDCISDIATMTDKEIDDLEYIQDDISFRVIKKQRKQLKHLLYWRDWKSRQLNHFTHEEWMKLTSDSFNDFCISILPDIIRGSAT